MFGFGQLCECLGGIIFTFVTFSHRRHFHLTFPLLSPSLLSLCVPISLLSFASFQLCLFVSPIASANLPLKTIPGLLQKCSTKHEFYMPCTQPSVNTFHWPLRVHSSHYRHTFPHWSGHTPASLVRVHIIGSRNTEKTSTILSLDEYLSMHDLNPDEMHQIKEIRMTAWCFIDHKPFLELWVFAENIYISGRNEWRVWSCGGRAALGLTDMMKLLMWHIKKKLYPLKQNSHMLLLGFFGGFSLFEVVNKSPSKAWIRKARCWKAFLLQTNLRKLPGGEW